MWNSQIDKDAALVAAKRLVGNQLVAAAHAADMREFGFDSPATYETARKARWWLHVLCSWRIEQHDSIVTGSFDWNEPENEVSDLQENWDPAYGGSLQEARLRALFNDWDRSKRSLVNNTNSLVVEEVEVNQHGDLIASLTDNLVLRVFPGGSRGEFWCIFRTDDPFYYSCKL